MRVLSPALLSVPPRPSKVRALLADLGPVLPQSEVQRTPNVLEIEAHAELQLTHRDGCSAGPQKAWRSRHEVVIDSLVYDVGNIVRFEHRSDGHILTQFEWPLYASVEADGRGTPVEALACQHPVYRRVALVVPRLATWHSYHVSITNVYGRGARSLGSRRRQRQACAHCNDRREFNVARQSHYAIHSQILALIGSSRPLIHVEVKRVSVIGTYGMEVEVGCRSRIAIRPPKRVRHLGSITAVIGISQLSQNLFIREPATAAG